MNYKEKFILIISIVITILFFLGAYVEMTTLSLLPRISWAWLMTPFCVANLLILIGRCLRDE